jgi:hypothetical protein
MSMDFNEAQNLPSPSACPWLGLADDRASRFSYPEKAHRCFATSQAMPVALEHQSAFCFGQRYQACSRFVEPRPEAISDHSTPKPFAEEPPHRSARAWRSRLVWLSLVGVLISLLVIGTFYISNTLVPQIQIDATANLVLLPPTPSLPATSTPTPTRAVQIQEITPTPTAVAFLATSTLTVTPLPGVKVYTLSPGGGDIGWVASGEEQGNHFGDSYLYAGIFEKQIFNSGFQFDLSAIPRGAPIYQAVLQLTGLRDDRLARRTDQSSAGGVWSLRLLGPEIDQDWRQHNFQEIFNAAAVQTLNPILSDRDLAVGQTNLFELSPAQIKVLETRLVEDEKPNISFRLEGPLVGPDNLFAWDTGYGPESQGNKVTLVINAGPPPATPPPFKYIVVTSTPTPENVVTAAAIVMQLTAEATRLGTATPVPPEVVTATPFPDFLVIVPTPTPENTATAQMLAAVATAEALTTGTPTPISTNAVTATPTPTETATPTATTPNYVLITSTPTPETVFAAVTQSAAATAQAQQVGSATPLPANWVTPIVVTETPTPINAATAAALADLATAIALTTGTPTSTPSNMVTATPTLIFELIPLLLTPTPTPFPTPTPASLPSALLGKILFLSDREGTESKYAYVYDPATGQLGRLTDSWPYYAARERDTYSPDTVFQVYTKKLLWTNVEDDEGVRSPTEELAIHLYDYKFKQEKIVTRMGAGIVYEPAWSPVNNEIAFVATESGNDEIWVINADGTQPRQLTRNTWEWDKTPSWSPDGKQIIFMSNRTGNQQLWLMNADGSDQKLLLGWDNWTPYNDWGPVWVKYLDPAPPADQER